MARAIFVGGTGCLLVLFAALLVWFPGRWLWNRLFQKEEPATLLVEAPDYDVQLLTPNA